MCASKINVHAEGTMCAGMPQLQLMKCRHPLLKSWTVCIQISRDVNFAVSWPSANFSSRKFTMFRIGSMVNNR